MTTRYITDAEKIGVKRRMAALRERKKKEGLKQYIFWLNITELEKVKEFIEVLRENLSDK